MFAALSGLNVGTDTFYSDLHVPRSRFLSTKAEITHSNRIKKLEVILTVHRR